MSVNQFVVADFSARVIDGAARVVAGGDIPRPDIAAIHLPTPLLLVCKGKTQNLSTARLDCVENDFRFPVRSGRGRGSGLMGC